MPMKQTLVKPGSTLLSLNKSARSELKINNDLTTKMSSHDANYATEAQNIISMINNMSGKYNEVKQVLETYHNNSTRIATDFESISRIITSLQSKINQRHSLVQNTNRRGSDRGFVIFC